MENNVLKLIKEEINKMHRIKRGFEYDVRNFEQPERMIEIFEQELMRTKKEITYLKKVYEYASLNAL